MAKSVVSQVSRGQGNEFLNKLEAAGLDSDLAQRVIDSKGNSLASKVVGLIADDDLNGRLSPGDAQSIMGRNYFGIGETIKYFGVAKSDALTRLAYVPFKVETLRACKDTHILVAVFPFSIMDIREKRGSLLRSDNWYNDEDFSYEKGRAEWKLVRKEPVACSHFKTWQRQQALLNENEEIPTARTMVYATLGHFLATGEKLFEQFYVRCADMDSHGARINVGRFNSCLDIDSRVENYGDGLIGLASARKPDF